MKILKNKIYTYNIIITLIPELTLDYEIFVLPLLALKMAVWCTKLLLYTGSGEEPNHKSLSHTVLPCIITLGAYNINF